MEQWQVDLNTYFEKWNEGFQTFDDEPIKAFYHDDFIGFWGNSRLTVPNQYDRDYNLKDTLQNMAGATKSFTLLHHAKRSEEDLSVVGIFTATWNGQQFPSHCMYILRKTDNGWKILREYIEIHR